LSDAPGKLGRLRLPLGVCDHLPERARALDAHQRSIARAFELAGYDRVETPEFELLEVLERGLGDAIKSSLFRMVDPSTGEIVVLRPDFTAQVARMVVARLSERPRPLRLFYQGRVLRAADALGFGLKARDVHQAGAELIGEVAPWADVEILILATRALSHAGRHLTIDLGHAAIIESLAPRVEDGTEIRQALASKDAARIRRIAPPLEPLLDLYGGAETLTRARAALAGSPPRVLAAIDELERVAQELASLAPDLTVSFDLGEERGLGYYTGLFFHGYLPGASDAILVGGRYDGLLSKYGRGEAAVGLGIDVDALTSALPSPPQRSGYVFAERDMRSPAFARAAEEKRSAGERAVLVAAEHADAYARANGYRVIVEMTDSSPIERAVRDGAER
jgi:ATP phosphoribosyltransferase regulatory subunit